MPLRRLGRRLRSALPLPGWVLLAALFVVAFCASVLSRTQWGPDSRLYLAWTYWYLGHPQEEAARMAYDYLHAVDGVVGCDICWPPGFERDFFSGPYAAVVGSRPLLPLLAAPLVAVLGPNGLVVVSALSYAIGVVATVALASRLWGPRLGAAAGALLLLPAVVSRWAAHSQTEALAFALTALSLLTLPLRRDSRRRDVWWYGLLVLLGMCTRQFAVALPAGVALAWLVVAVRDRRMRNPWLPFAITGVGVALATLLAQTLLVARLFGGELSLRDRWDALARTSFGETGPAAVPEVVRTIALGDWSYVRTDTVLVVVLALAVVAAVWRVRSEVTAIAVGTYAVVLVINVVAFWPAYFRYQAPAFPLVVLAVVALAADLWAPRRRSPWRSTERLSADEVTAEQVTAEQVTAEQVTPEQVTAEQVTPGQVTPGQVTAAEGTPGEVTAGEASAARPGEAPADEGGDAGARRPRRAGALILAGLGALVTVVGVLRYWQYVPETRYQLAWAARFLGASPEEAASRARAALQGIPWTPASCGGACWPPGTEWLFAATGEPTVLYPLLSAPFVAALGSRGLLVVPLLAGVAAFVLVFVAVSRRYGPGWGFVAGFALLTTQRFGYAAVVATPDTLALALSAGLLWVLPFGRRPGRLWAAALLLGLVLTARGSAVALSGGLLAAWMVRAVRERSVRNAWTPFAAVGLAVTAGVLLLGRVWTPLRIRTVDGWRGLVGDGDLPAAVARRVSVLAEADARLVAPDRMLTAVVLLGLVAAVIRLRRDLAAYVLGATAVSLVLYVTQGVPTGLRGLNVLLPGLLMLGVGFLAEVTAGWREGLSTRVEEERFGTPRPGTRAATEVEQPVSTPAAATTRRSEEAR